MTMTDPVADMLTRLRNANSAHHDSVSLPSSKLKSHIAEILKQEGYISAWEVETALSPHPDIAECAVVGVPAEIGEHDILCFVMLRDGARFDPAALAAWCEEAMPRHHVPRYWKEVDGFARTPSQRIRKDLLDRSPAGAFDRETSQTGT